MNNLLLPRGHKDSSALTKKLLTADSVKWERTSKSRAFKLFKSMSVTVPAYDDFLKLNSINKSNINAFSDLSKIPCVDKDNYLRKYTKEDLCWGGKFGVGSWVISTTSGTSGEPYYFPRQMTQDLQYAISAEQYLISNFDIKNNKTLYIVAFPMGAWIGGVFTYEAIKIISEKGYDLSIITPGIHKQEILNAIKQMSSSFDQIIIGAYAPFLKDILEDGIKQGIDWRNINVKFIFSAEAFPESFRDYLSETVGLKDIYKDTLNHYGTVDIGTMAHETPLSILIRRKLIELDKLDLLFPESTRQPTLCQYDPTLFYFEERANILFCSSYSGIPLFRYNLKDYGGVIPYKKMIRLLSKAGIDINAELRKANLNNTKWKLPFVYVYERNDLSVSYYAFNLYPEPVKKALLDKELQTIVTGKFTMFVDYGDKGEQKLNIIVESMHKDISNPIKESELIQKRVHDRLLKESTEYPEIFSMIGDKVKPNIILKPYEDSDYFKIGAKQKWIKK